MLSKDQWITAEEAILDACACGDLSEADAVADLVKLGYSISEATETIERELN